MPCSPRHGHSNTEERRVVFLVWRSFATEYGLRFKPSSGLTLAAFEFSNRDFSWKKAGCEAKRGLLTTSPNTRTVFQHPEQPLSTEKSEKNKIFLPRWPRATKWPCTAAQNLPFGCSERYVGQRSRRHSNPGLPRYKGFHDCSAIALRTRMGWHPRRCPPQQA